MTDTPSKYVTRNINRINRRSKKKITQAPIRRNMRFGHLEQAVAFLFFFYLLDKGGFNVV